MVDVIVQNPDEAGVNKYLPAYKPQSQVSGTITETPGFDSIASEVLNISDLQPTASIYLELVVYIKLIYPAAAGSVAQYRLGHALMSNASPTFDIFRLDGPSPEILAPADIHIYQLHAQSKNAQTSVQLEGKSEASYQSATLRSHHSKSWTVAINENGKIKPLYKACVSRSSPTWTAEWKDSVGKTLAVETRLFDSETSWRPVLRIMEALDQRSMDLLVSAWCSRVWLDSRPKRMTFKQCKHPNFDTF
jgi:hypothetical protein